MAPFSQFISYQRPYPRSFFLFSDDCDDLALAWSSCIQDPYGAGPEDTFACHLDHSANVELNRVTQFNVHKVVQSQGCHQKQRPKHQNESPSERLVKKSSAVPRQYWSPRNHHHWRLPLRSGGSDSSTVRAVGDAVGHITGATCSPRIRSMKGDVDITDRSWVLLTHPRTASQRTLRKCHELKILEERILIIYSIQARNRHTVAVKLSVATLTPPEWP